MRQIARHKMFCFSFMLLALMLQPAGAAEAKIETQQENASATPLAQEAPSQFSIHFDESLYNDKGKHIGFQAPTSFMNHHGWLVFEEPLRQNTFPFDEENEQRICTAIWELTRRTVSDTFRPAFGKELRRIQFSCNDEITHINVQGVCTYSNVENLPQAVQELAAIANVRGHYLETPKGVTPETLPSMAYFRIYKPTGNITGERWDKTLDRTAPTAKQEIDNHHTDIKKENAWDSLLSLDDALFKKTVKELLRKLITEGIKDIRSDNPKDAIVQIGYDQNYNSLSARFHFSSTENIHKTLEEIMTQLQRDDAPANAETTF